MVAGTCVADDAYLILTRDTSYFVDDDAGGLFKRDIEIKNAPCRANRGLAQTLHYDLSVLSMSPMGFLKKIWIEGWVGEFYPVFWGKFWNFV